MRKVVLIGTGAVGCAYAYSLVNQGLITELVLIDINNEKAEGEAMDLAYGMAFAPTNIKIKAGTYSDCTDANLVVITAGANQKPGETRLELVNKNATMIKSIVQEVVKSGFNGIFLIASNPVDILTYVVQKESKFPPNKVIGSGTTLDTARFKILLGEYFEVDPRNVHAAIIGEHGDTQVPIWSQASIGIENLDKLLERRNNPKDKENLDKISIKVRNAAYEIINRKGFTNYGVGMCLTRITKAILDNENSILPVSCLLEGQYGERDIYLSVPAIVNEQGIKEVLEIDLNETEKELFKKSVNTLKEIKY
ncbi:L-lactate dehydrogenase [Desulfonispora thiosulfatigenes DSM 11270]|uniref:L-lactate dehydrogenase n=1 Tax=Desulfonispora thiosulfatigenes DSM 11270 TaxID=656914 RepID=A0A1W1V741_DESTI|nr:L-lactate dehydrogenase [Desulfonispora thiosulfatigenes]SMB88841.1 L-lactate dehydrogenase [Desulfonispora thiosulfatigenes DSM 11270]